MAAPGSLRRSGSGSPRERGLAASFCPCSCFSHGARLSVIGLEAHSMKFTVVATGQFSLGRAFGFGLTASSLSQLSVVNSPIRPAGLAPAWPPASPAHTRIPKSKSSAAQPHGERTPLACGFRQLAENPVPKTFSRQNRTKNVRRRFGRAAQTGTRAACATHSYFGVRAQDAPAGNRFTASQERLIPIPRDNRCNG